MDRHPTDLSAVRRPINQARGLPNAHYIDDAVVAEENDAVLAHQWAGLAVAADVPEIGDAIPMTFLGMPLLLVRSRSGSVRVFQNICRHRGMILVAEPRKIEGAIRCPYHSWCYSTDGALVSTPHVGGPGQNTHEDIDRALLGLIEVRSHVWRDVVWINLSGDAPAFKDAFSDLINRWADFDKPLYHGGSESNFRFDVNCNWKLAVENYCESYHLPWIHPGLNSYSKLEDHYHIEEPGKFSGQGTHVYRQFKSETDDVFPDFPGVGNKWEDAAEYIAAYPNVLLGAQRDHAYAIILEPAGKDRTIEHVHIYYAEPDVDENMRINNADLWKGVFDEDVFVVEGMQRGRLGSGFDGGKFSPAMDGPTHNFHDWVATKVEAHRARKKQSNVAAE